jgi:hypothetical protein
LTPHTERYPRSIDGSTKPPGSFGAKAFDFGRHWLHQVILSVRSTIKQMSHDGRAFAVLSLTVQSA